MATVLVVAEEGATRRLVEVNLRARGYQTLSARSPAEALHGCGGWAVDLVLLDAGCPAVGGPDVGEGCRRLRCAWGCAVVVMEWAHQRGGAGRCALEQWVDGLLLKPFGVPELLAAVRRALGRRGAGVRRVSAARVGGALP